MMTNQKTHPILLAIVVIAFAVSLASCASAQSRELIKIIQTAIARLNAGDVDGLMKLYAEDAIISDVTGRSVGSQAVRATFQEVVKQGVRLEITKMRVDGNVVSWTYDVFAGNNKIDTQTAIDVIQDGLIIFEGTEASLRYECSRDPSRAFCPAK